MPAEESNRQDEAVTEESKGQDSNERVTVTHEVSLKSVIDSLSEKGFELN